MLAVLLSSSEWHLIIKWSVTAELHSPLNYLASIFRKCTSVTGISSKIISLAYMLWCSVGNFRWEDNQTIMRKLRFQRRSQKFSDFSFYKGLYNRKWMVIRCPFQLLYQFTIWRFRLHATGYKSIACWSTNREGKQPPFFCFATMHLSQINAGCWG